MQALEGRSPEFKYRRVTDCRCPATSGVQVQTGHGLSHVPQPHHWQVSVHTVRPESCLWRTWSKDRRAKESSVQCKACAKCMIIAFINVKKHQQLPRKTGKEMHIS